MKYILELEDEPNKEYFGEGNYYRCKQIPYWSISESMRNRLEPYDEADRKTENSSEKPNNCELQTIRCPKCGRTDYIRDMEKDMGIKDSHYKYKCINCNTYIKDEPQTEETEAERLDRIDNEIEDAWARIRELTDEPQTERSK